MPFTRVEFAGALATVTLDHPEGNRINFDMRAELLDAFEQVAASAARVLIVRDEGADFCSAVISATGRELPPQL